MKVHLIKKQSIDEFVKNNSRSKVSFERWLAILKRVDWTDLQDMNKTFKSADILGQESNRVVFNIGGNNYRMICKYNFGKSMIHLFVKWIGTHAEYTQLCNQGKQYDVNNF